MRTFRLLLTAVAVALNSLPSAAQALPQEGAPQEATGPSTPIIQDPRTTQEAYERGVQAEQAGDWETAFQAYSEAARYSVSDRTILLRREFARFELVQQYTDRAERNLLSGQTELARADLQAALRLDPGYSVAQERLAQLSGTPPPTPLQLTSMPPEVEASPGTRDFDYRGTSRGAYEEIARQFGGLTPAFDGDMTDQPLRFRAVGVDFATAMRLLAEQTNTFWVAVNAQTFFVTDNTEEKRRQYAPEVKQTILLPASETPDDMTETTRVVRDITGVRRSVLDVSTHTLTVRDTPNNVALARALIDEVEQPRGELLLDISLLEVDRQAAQRIGITPPSQARLFSLSTGDIRRLADAQDSGALQEVLASIFGASPTALAQGGLAALIPPLVAFGGGDTVFLATLPGASADFSRSFSAVRQARRLLLRAEDGRTATFFSGDRFPITLALLSDSIVAPTSGLISGILPGAFPRTNTDVGQAPTSIAAGDFDSDQALDVAVANQGDNSVSVLLGNEDGSFNLQADLSTGASPSGIVATDLNADSATDLAVTNQADSTLSIFLGHGDGTFDDEIELGTGAGPVAVTTGDFNRDGRLDLAVANQGGNSVSILIGSTGGSFSPREDFLVGDAPSALAVGDFDNDGEADVAVANGASNTLSILLGDGDGGFDTRTDVPAGAGPAGVAAADFDGNGRLDLAVVNRTDDTVSLFPGNGDGTFDDREDAETGAGPAAIVSADFNSDDRPDLVTANRSANTVSVFLGLGNEMFADRLDLNTDSGPVAMAAGDLNGDSLLDLIVANQSANTISAIRNTAVISVTPSAPLTAYPASEYVDLGLRVSVTPRLHPNNEVTLNLEIDVSSLSGQNVNGIPILSNRTIAHTVRLQEDQTNILGGLVQTSRMRGISGLPGLAQAGIVGHLAGLRTSDDSETELLITITPRRIRLARRTDSLFYAGRGASEPTQPEAPSPQGEPSIVPPPEGAPPGEPVPGTEPGAPGTQSEREGTPQRPLAEPTIPQPAAGTPNP